MEELDDMFSNRVVVADATADALKMVVQTYDSDGNILTHDEQIELAKNMADN